MAKILIIEDEENIAELERDYLESNGFEVDIASTKGGEPPIVLDDDDMREYDYAFLNDPEAQAKVTNTLLIDDVNPADYEAVYFVGGKGAMFDFPDNPAIKNIIKHLYQNDKVISAVCHGPAALVNVKLDNGVRSECRHESLWTSKQSPTGNKNQCRKYRKCLNHDVSCYEKAPLLLREGLQRLKVSRNRADR